MNSKNRSLTLIFCLSLLLALGTGCETEESPSSVTRPDSETTANPAVDASPPESVGEAEDVVEITADDLISRVIAGEDFAGQRLTISGVALSDVQDGLVNVGTRADYDAESFDNFVSVYGVDATIREGEDVELTAVVESSSASDIGGQTFVLIEASAVN